VFTRTNETFENLDSIEALKNPLVKVHRCRDWGPITKLLGTLETEKDPDTLIVVVDDDHVYPRHLTQTMKQWAADEPLFVVAGHDVDVNILSNPERDFLGSPFNNSQFNDMERSKSVCCCRFFEGYGGVGYRVGFFQRNLSLNFSTYLSIALTNPKCYRSDDLVISNYLALVGIQGINARIQSTATDANEDAYALYKQPMIGENLTSTHEMDPTTTLVHPTHAHRKQIFGHPYYLCSKYLVSKGIGFLKPIVPAELLEETLKNVTAMDGWLMQCARDRTVWLIDKQMRRPIKAGAFTRLGFDVQSIRKIDNHRNRCQFEIFYLPEGPPIV